MKKYIRKIHQLLIPLKHSHRKKIENKIRKMRRKGNILYTREEIFT